MNWLRAALIALLVAAPLTLTAQVQDELFRLPELEHVVVSTGQVITVAAADTPPSLRSTADFRCDGEGDQSRINAALARASLRNGQAQVATRPQNPATLIDAPNSGYIVQLLPGSYHLSAPIDVGTAKFGMLRGSGPSTVIVPPANNHAIVGVRSNQDMNEHFTIRDLRIDGGPDFRGWVGLYLMYGRHFVVENVDAYRTGLNGVVVSAGQFTVRSDDSDANADWAWVASGSGTNEYRLTFFQSKNSGKGIPHLLTEPTGLVLGGVSATKGTVGSLTAGQWGWGDTDTLGFNTVYVRKTDGTQPASAQVRLNGSTGSAHLHHVVVRNSGKRGVVLRGIHDTTVSGVQAVSNTEQGFVAEHTFNLSLSGSGIEDNNGGTSADVGLVVWDTLDTRISSVIVENSVILDSTGGSFIHVSQLAATGNVTLSQDTGGSSAGVYHFNNCRFGTLSTIHPVNRIHLDGGVVSLGNITTQYFHAAAMRFTVDGTASVLTLEERTDNDMGAYFAGCHWRGTASNNVYGFTFIGNGATVGDFAGVTISGGKLHTMALNFEADPTGSSKAINAQVAISGVVNRQSALTFNSIDQVILNGNTIAGTGANVTIDDADQAISITGNAFNNLTITVNNTSAANGVFVGNLDRPASGATTFTNNGTGTWVNASNAVITGGN